MMGERGLEVWTATRADGSDRQTHVRPKSRSTRRRRRSRTRTGAVRHAARLAGPCAARRQRRCTRLTVPLNDSLTSFRIVAVANAGADLFGTGTTNIATTQDSDVAFRPAAAWCAKATATRPRSRCATPRRKLASVRATAKTSPCAAVGFAGAQRFDLAAGAARDIVWDVTAPFGASSLAWDVSLETDGARDRLSRQPASRSGHSRSHVPGDARAARPDAVVHRGATCRCHSRTRRTGNFPAGTARRSSRRRPRFHGVVSVRLPRTAVCRKPSRYATPRPGIAGWKTYRYTSIETDC